MKNLAIILGIVIVIGAAVLIIPFGRDNNTEGGNTQQQQAAVPATTLDLPLVGEDGSATSVGAFLGDGKALVVNSWATWCPFCVEELPDFVTLQEQFPDDIRVIAVNRNESSGTAQAFLQNLGVAGKLTYLLDPKDAWYRKNGGFTMPETLFINARGEVVVHKRGFMTIEEMRQHVAAAIGSVQ